MDIPICRNSLYENAMHLQAAVNCESFKKVWVGETR